MEREQLYHMTKFSPFSWERLGANSLATANMAAKFALVFEVLLDDNYAFHFIEEDEDDSPMFPCFLWQH